MGDVRDPDRDQMAPIPNERPSAHDLVSDDMLERKAYGLNKYASLLQAGNGRNALQDLYEELMDAVVYVRTELEERRENISFAWDLLDQNPVLATQCIIQQAPVTLQLIRVAVMREISSKIANAGELRLSGTASWLRSEADRLQNEVLAELDEAARV